MSICLAPSGARFSCTALSVADEDYMADRTVPDTRKTNEMMRKHVHLEDGAGLYPGHDLSKYLFGDRFWMTLLIRARSYKPEVYIDLTCKNPACNKPVHASMNIYRALLPFVPESVEHLEEVKNSGILLDDTGHDWSVWYPTDWIMDREHEDMVCVPEFEGVPDDPSTWIDVHPTEDGQYPVYFKMLSVKDRNQILEAAMNEQDFRGRFSTTLPDSKQEVIFRMMSGADVPRISNLERTEQGKMQSSSMLCRITKFGEHERVNREMIRKLSGRDGSHLRDEMDEHDCGVDLWLQLRCNPCKNVYEYDLPLSADFFAPGSNKRRYGKRG
jgi:hypothetical protein